MPLDLVPCAVTHEICQSPDRSQLVARVLFILDALEGLFVNFLPPLLNNFRFLVYIDKDCPKLAHSVTNILVLVICKQENTWSQPHKVLLELGVQHNNVTKALCSTLDVLKVVESPMDL